MSFELSNTKGKPSYKTTSNGCGKGFMENDINIGDYYIDVEDFVELVMYFMTNTDLDDNDIRKSLKKRIESLHEVDGWNGFLVRNRRYEETNNG